MAPGHEPKLPNFAELSYKSLKKSFSATLNFVLDRRKFGVIIFKKVTRSKKDVRTYKIRSILGKEIIRGF